MSTSDSRPTSVLELTDDETKALAWAAYRGAAELRREGWADMACNADILDGVRRRLEVLGDDE